MSRPQLGRLLQSFQEPQEQIMQCQILEGRFPNHRQKMESLRAAELTVYTDEFERMALTYCPHGAIKMLVAAFVAGTVGMTIQPNAETAALLEGLAKRFQ
jgi:hypothetical protein